VTKVRPVLISVMVIVCDTGMTPRCVVDERVVRIGTDQVNVGVDVSREYLEIVLS